MMMHCYEKDAGLPLGVFFSYFSLLISSAIIGTCSATRPSDISLAKTDAYERNWVGDDGVYSPEEDTDLLYGGQGTSNVDIDDSAIDTNFHNFGEGNLEQNYNRFSRGSDLGRNFLRFGKGKLGSNFIRFGRVRDAMFQDGGQHPSALSDKRGQLNKNFLRFGRSHEDQGPRRVKRLAMMQNRQPSPKKRAIRVRSTRRINGGIVDGGKRDALYRNFLRFGKRTAVEENCDPNDPESGQCPDALAFETQVAQAVVYNRTLPKRGFLWLTFKSTNKNRRRRPSKLLVAEDQEARQAYLQHQIIDKYLRFG